jgi:hypothetical protein
MIARFLSGIIPFDLSKILISSVAISLRTALRSLLTFFSART